MSRIDNGIPRDPASIPQDSTSTPIDATATASRGAGAKASQLSTRAIDRLDPGDKSEFATLLSEVFSRAETGAKPIVAFGSDEEGGVEDDPVAIRPGSFLANPTDEGFAEIEPLIVEFLAAAQEDFAVSTNPQVDRTAAEVMAWVTENETRLRELGLFDSALELAQRALDGAASRNLEQWAGGVGGIAALRVGLGDLETNDLFLSHTQLAAAIAMDGVLPTLAGLAPAEQVNRLLEVGTLAGTGGAIAAWASAEPGVADSVPISAESLAIAATASNGDTRSSLSDLLGAFGLGGDFSFTVQGALSTLTSITARTIGGALGGITVGLTVAGGAAAHAGGTLSTTQAVLLGLSVAAGSTAVVLGLALGGPGVAFSAAVIGGIAIGLDVASALLGGQDAPDVPDAPDGGDSPDPSPPPDAPDSPPDQPDTPEQPPEPSPDPVDQPPDPPEQPPEPSPDPVDQPPDPPEQPPEPSPDPVDQPPDPTPDPGPSPDPGPGPPDTAPDSPPDTAPDSPPDTAPDSPPEPSPDPVDQPPDPAPDPAAPVGDVPDAPDNDTDTDVADGVDEGANDGLDLV